MLLNSKFLYKFKSNGEKVDDIYLKHSGGTTYYKIVGVNGKVEDCDTKYLYEHIEEYENNINQDIIKLIESGYEFRTFWGTTLDGKEFHVEMQNEDEAESQTFNINPNDLF